MFPRYKHYKGGIYKVISIGKHTETGEELVIYVDGELNAWIRPYDMFFGTVNVNGSEVRRFEPIS